MLRRSLTVDCVRQLLRFEALQLARHAGIPKQPHEGLSRVVLELRKACHHSISLCTIDSRVVHATHLRQKRTVDDIGKVN
jgi:hypothetical protein